MTRASVQFSKHWARSGATWGAGVGAAVFLVRAQNSFLGVTSSYPGISQLLSVTPLVRREVLEKTPGVRRTRLSFLDSP